MPRFRHLNGAVVSVSDEKAARLGHGWEPVEKPKKAPARKKAETSDDDE